MRRRRLRVSYRARYRRGWTARLATAGLIRSLQATRLEDGRPADEIRVLLEVMHSARDERAAAMARAAIEQAWATGGATREAIWHAVWVLLGNAYFGWRVHQADDAVRPLLQFLLVSESDSRYVPRVRLLACLPPDPGPDPGGQEQPRAHRGEPEVDALVEVAVSGGDTAITEPLVGLLCATDHPRLLTEIARALLRRRGGTSRCTDAGYVPVASTYGLWTDGDQPTPLLRIMLANPHLLGPPCVPAFPELALVMILRDRFDLLREYDQARLAEKLLEFLAADHEPIVTAMPPQVLAGCRRALRELPPGPGQEVVCWRAMAGDAEAVTAVRDAGYLPGEPRLVPLLLFLTQQWSRYHDTDPHGGLLFAGIPFLPPHQVERTVRRVLAARRLPAEVTEKVRRALRDLGPHPVGRPAFDEPWVKVRDIVCHRAMRDDPEAKAAAIDAGYLPSEQQLHPAFLFLTEQWARYDRLDPDGRLLRDHLATAWLDDLPLPAFQKIAERTGRPDPCPPPRRRASHRDSTHAGTHHSDYGTSDGSGFDSGGHTSFSGGSFGL